MWSQGPFLDTEGDEFRRVKKGGREGAVTATFRVIYLANHQTSSVISTSNRSPAFLSQLKHGNSRRHFIPLSKM